jgi:hypothetical protein
VGTAEHHDYYQGLTPKQMAVEFFADNAGWANFFVRSESYYHTLANKLMSEWHSEGVGVVTPNYVLLELVALLSCP